MVAHGHLVVEQCAIGIEEEHIERADALLVVVLRVARPGDANLLHRVADEFERHAVAVGDRRTESAVIVLTRAQPCQ